MKTLIKTPICFILIFLLFLQSCTVYKNEIASLEDASRANTRILVETFNDKKLHFRRVEKIDSTFYGIKKSKGQFLKIPLDKKEIKAVAIKDKRGSLLANIGIFIGFLGVSGISYHYLQ